MTWWRARGPSGGPWIYYQPHEHETPRDAALRACQRKNGYRLTYELVGGQPPEGLREIRPGVYIEGSV